MDLKADDALNVDIDPHLLLSYELEKLNLDEFKSELNLDPNDYNFDQLKLTDESPKNDDKLCDKNDFLLLKDKKVNESVSFICTEIKTEKTFASEDESHCCEIKAETPSEYSEIKKDINGNEESISQENLNKHFVDSEASDSDNEEEEDDDDADHIIERGPLKPRRHASRNREANNLLYRNENYDRSQFNSERLRFWCGSSQIIGGSAAPNHYGVYNNNQTTMYGGIEPSNTLSGVESFFEDARASSVSSPESGYDSSSAHSSTGSPPPALFTSVNIPEVDEPNILDLFIENTDSALIDSNLGKCNIDDKDAEITKILNYLYDIPSELNESSTVTNLSHPLLNAVPSANHSTLSNTSDVRSSPVSCNTVSKNVEMPQKLKPKLKEDAKVKLKQHLTKDIYYDASKKIYEKVRDDKSSGKNISVIFIEDEMDKDSKNRTNLHNAVLNEKIEEIFSIVEIHKQYDLPFSDINIRDKDKKTALDYAMEKDTFVMTLVADYLRENTACESVKIKK